MSLTKNDMKEETKEEFLKELWTFADVLVADMGIEMHMTDIYLANLLDFGDENEALEVLKKHGLVGFEPNTPLALLALAKIEGREMVELTKDFKGEVVHINKKQN